jgi:CO/xanthine dehydrogenase Mo-binding subunit
MDSRRLRRRVNPLLVDEQVRGGTVQGIGAVLLQGAGATLAHSGGLPWDVVDELTEAQAPNSQHQGIGFSLRL